MYKLLNHSNIELYFHENNENIIKDFLENEKFHILSKKMPKNSILSLGWDGTFLSAIRNYSDKNILGLNFGNRWNLLADIEDILPNLELNSLEINIFKYTINNQLTWVFANEINLTGWSGQIVDMLVEIENIWASQLKWDWVIVATPLGSTWYNSSLNWPMLQIWTKLLTITPKTIFEPKWQQPIVINDTNIIYINNINRILPTEIYADWQKLLFSDEKIEIKIEKINTPVKILKINP